MRAGLCSANFLSSLLDVASSMKTNWLLWGNGQVNPVVDVTDWYQEELQLDDKGVPSASYWCGAGECKWMPLTAIQEDYVVRDVPPLKREGRTETWTRWVTFDGRMIREFEGRSASEDEVLEDGETLVNLGGVCVVPGEDNELVLSTCREAKRCSGRSEAPQGAARRPTA